MDTPILTSQINQEDKSLGDSYLKFHLDPQTPAILAMEHVQEVLLIPPRRITPMPNMPECVLGLINRHNRVVWGIDLAQMLSLQPLSTNAQHYNVVIVKVGKSPLGLVVQEVKGLTRFTPDSIQAPTGLVNSFLTSYLHGCILQQQEVLLVLNAKAIMVSPCFIQ